MKVRHFLPLAAIVVLGPFVLGENETGFIERFALAADREKVLGELVPGTEDYYFFHALHYQNTRQAARLATILDQWKKRVRQSGQRDLIENREALLAYDANPERTLAFLREHYQLRFDHVQEQPDAKPDLPTRLDPALITFDAFVHEAQRNEDLRECTPEALAQLVTAKMPLNPAQRRAVLARIQRPNVPGLVELIAEDLGTRESKGFGEFPIHHYLLPAQLDQLAKLRPQVAVVQAFVFARLRHLSPSAEEDIEFDPAARVAWLDRTWAYVKGLPPAFNSLKAVLLYHRLEHDRRLGVYDEARFIEYLKLPRRTSYAPTAWLERLRAADTVWADLNVSFPNLGGLPAVRSDESLVRDYFLHLFAEKPKAGWERFAEWVRDTWLKPVFAEALLVRGLGNAEQLASLLTPDAFRQLNERVDLDFRPTNPQFFAPGDDVSLDLEVKNAPKLIVKVYELNALNYFLTNKRELNTDLPLDGLVANAETTHSFDEPALRRVRRTFKFPELKDRRGAWIVEFIGGGRSSRALIRKGQWHLVQRTGPAGDLLTVLDENHRPVSDAAVWFDGRKFTAAAGATVPGIPVPFTAQPGRKSVVLADAAGTFATLTTFEHHAEQYALDAQFYVDREQLLAGKEATLSVRTALRLHDASLPLTLLRDPKLVITTETLDGIETTRELKDPKLDATGLLTFRFPVPARLEVVNATLSAEVDQLSQNGAKARVSASDSWTVNSIDRTEATYDGHLLHLDTGYAFELLGKNAEPLADRQVVFSFTHDWFDHEITVPLRSDAKGRIALGPLGQIRQLEAKLPDDRMRTWPLRTALRATDDRIHVVAGQPFEVSLQTLAGHFALLENRPDTFAGDWTKSVEQPAGARLPHLNIRSLAPGDYTLLLPNEGRSVSIKVTRGTAEAGWIFGPARSLQLSNANPLRIEQITSDAAQVVVTLANWDRFTRVHVAATRFVDPEKTLFSLGGFTRFGVGEESPARLPNLFAAGRDIGDEYRYILERRYALKFPGNMLARPGLVLNPWEKRTTEQSALDLKAGGVAGATAGGRKAMPVPGLEKREHMEAKSVVDAGGTANLDFLAKVAPVLTDLVPDEKGIVRIDRARLGDRTLVQVLATNLSEADWREFPLSEAPVQVRDLRLARSLDPAKSFAEKKRFSLLTTGQTLTFTDRLSSELETYDTLASVFGLYRTLGENQTLATFAWILEWPNLKDEEKRAKYSEFACHELNFFLSRKDPEFFAKVIRPYLQNKKDKTFLDEYLLGADLRRYLEPWCFGQLNAAERALLAARLPADARNIARHLQERWELLPPKVEEQDRFFETALRGRAMDEGERPAALAMTPTTPTAFGDRGAIGALAPPPPPASPAPAMAAKPVDAPAADAEMGRKAKSGVAGKEMAEAAYNETRARALYKSVDEFVAGVDVVKLREDARTQAYYRKLGPTKEWAENNYYHLPIERQGPELIPVNAFWRDYAVWVADGAKAPFLSANFAEAHRSFAETMLALAVLDLPFDAPKHETKIEGPAFTLKAGGPVIAVHKEVLPATPAEGQAELLVSQNFYRHGERYQMEGNEKFDRYVTEEFLAGAVYGANVVVTNPTSSPQKLDLLLQIPRGALPVLGTKPTDSRRVRLEPFTTQSFEYAFYFPAPGANGEKFLHYPVNVAKDEKIVGSAKPFAFPVAARLTQVDKASWDFVSQSGSEADVFAYLDQHNIERLDLERIAWRCRQSADFFRKLVTMLGARHRFDETIYRYGIAQHDTDSVREWLRHREDLLGLVGPWFDSPIVRFDQVERRTFELLDYSPLVNQRAHRLGPEHRIANQVVLEQYRSLLTQLAHKPALDAADSLSVTGFLFLQDRVEEALARFKSINADALPTRLQHDYFRCYAAFYEGDLASARGVANQYADHPVEHWRNLFRDVIAQLDEIEGKADGMKKDGTQPDREGDTARLAGNAPTFDFKVENRTIALTWRNLHEATLNYYLIDPEFSFSSNPFVSAEAGRFSIIKPSKVVSLPLPDGKDALDVPLPVEFAQANVLVEVLAAGQRKTQAYHANTLKLKLTENYGRLEIRDQGAGKPVSKAYVKVYARLRNGTVRYFKDGYTDLRGRFDYASLNSSDSPIAFLERVPGNAPAGSLDTQMLKPGELDQVERLSLLVMSEKDGALVREVAPPAQ